MQGSLPHSLEVESPMVHVVRGENGALLHNHVAPTVKKEHLLWQIAEYNGARGNVPSSASCSKCEPDSAFECSKLRVKRFVH